MIVIRSVMTFTAYREADIDSMTNNSGIWWNMTESHLYDDGMSDVVYELRDMDDFSLASKRNDQTWFILWGVHFFLMLVQYTRISRRYSHKYTIHQYVLVLRLIICVLSLAHVCYWNCSMNEMGDYENGTCSPVFRHIHKENMFTRNQLWLYHCGSTT